jgi:hypothetical protein
VDFFQSYNRLSNFRLLIGNTAVFITRAGVNVDKTSVQSLSEGCLHPSLTAA